MSERIIGLYTDILHFAKLEVDDQGFSWLPGSKGREPFNVDGKRLVLPMHKHLKDPKEKTIFNPLTENVIRGESEVIEKLKLTLAVQINQAIDNLGHDLLNLVANTDQHKLLSPEQSQLVINVKRADEKTIAEWDKISKRALEAGSFHRSFFSIFLRRGGEVQGKRYSRAGIVNFPFYDELLENGAKVTRQRDKETFRELLEFMFPDLELQEQYCYGSNSTISPFLDALLNACVKVTTRINELTNSFSKFIPEPDQIRFDDAFLDRFSNLEDLSLDLRLIPLQPGNEGKAEIPAVTEQQQQPAQAAVATPKMEARSSSQPMTYQEMMSKTYPQMSPAYQQPMQQAPMNRQMYEAVRTPSWALPQAQQPVMMGGGMQMQPQGMVMMTPNGPMQMQTQGYGMQPQMQPQAMVIVGYQPNGQPMYGQGGQMQPQMMMMMPNGMMMGGRSVNDEPAAR